MVGGSDPLITGLVTSDIVVRQNYVTKPAEWATTVFSTKGRLWVVKNLFELKNSRRTLIENNIFDGNWAGGQTGIAIVLKSSNQSGACWWCVSEQITFRWNWIRNSPGAFSLHGLDDYAHGGGIVMHHASVTDNLITGVGTHSGTRRQFQITGGQHLDIERNTCIDPALTHVILWDGTPSDSMRFRANLMVRGTYGVFGSNYGEGTTAINHYMPYGVFLGNEIVGAPSSRYPAGNSYPMTVDPTIDAGVDQNALLSRLQGVEP